jgi:hypothetical protein
MFGKQVQTYFKKMKKNSIRFIKVLLTCFLFSLQSYSQSQTKGLVNISDWFIRMFDTIPVKQETKIWFKDSCVVYEIRANFESSESTPEGTVVKRSSPVWKYAYLDLRNMHCQEYLHFKDTALPFCNYVLKPGEMIGWKFYMPKSPRDTGTGIISMSDTLINNKVFKRLNGIWKDPVETLYNISYLDCNAPKNMFYMAKTISEMYPGCKVTRSDIFDSNGKLLSRFEFEVIRDMLNVQEEALFKQWEENSAKTKLPLLSHSEAEQIMIPNPEHENPTITIVPLNRNH